MRICLESTFTFRIAEHRQGIVRVELLPEEESMHYAIMHSRKPPVISLMVIPRDRVKALAFTTHTMRLQYLNILL